MGCTVMDILEQTKDLDHLFKNISKFIILFTKKEAIELGLTVPRFKVLWLIDKLAPVNMTRLKEDAYMANSTLTVIVDALVADDLVKRHRDSADRRVVLLEVTKQGKEKLSQILELRQKFLQECLNKLKLDEQHKLIALLTPVLGYMEDYFESYD